MFVWNFKQPIKKFRRGGTLCKEECAPSGVHRKDRLLNKSNKRQNTALKCSEGGRL